MASIHTDTLIDARPQDVWAALRDWGRPHEVLVPGFVTATELDGADRIVTFADGSVARELFVDCDEERRRLVWAIVGGAMTHHNGVAQVLEEPDGRTRFVWTADILPHELADQIGPMMALGASVVKKTLEAQAASQATVA